MSVRWLAIGIGFALLSLPLDVSAGGPGPADRGSGSRYEHGGLRSHHGSRFRAHPGTRHDRHDFGRHHRRRGHHRDRHPPHGFHSRHRHGGFSLHLFGREADVRGGFSFRGFSSGSFRSFGTLPHGATGRWPHRFSGAPVVIIRKPFFCFPHGAGFSGRDAFVGHLHEAHGLGREHALRHAQRLGERFVFFGF